MTSNMISLDVIDKYADNIYEAIIIIAKRARQINAEQKQYIETELVIDSDIDDYEDEETEITKYDAKDYVELPKPTRMAIDEFLEGRLKFEYIDRNGGESEA